MPCSLLQRSEEHLAWSLPGASCVTLGKFLTSLILCFLIFVVGTKCIIACEALQRSPGWDGALNWCLATRLQCLEMTLRLWSFRLKVGRISGESGDVEKTGGRKSNGSTCYGEHKVLNFTVNREMQMKTTITCHLNFIRLVKTKSLTTSHVAEDTT